MCLRNASYFSLDTPQGTEKAECPLRTKHRAVNCICNIFNSHNDPLREEPLSPDEDSKALSIVTCSRSHTTSQQQVATPKSMLFPQSSLIKVILAAG